jgi:hypothetical protein
VLGLSVSPLLVFAQNIEQAQHNDGRPGTELIAWTQMQKPEPVPSPHPVPLPDQPQAPQQAPDAQKPASGSQQDDMQKQNAAQSFMGTVVKAGDKYVLKTADSTTYQLDDQDRAKTYEGKQVQVTGTLDAKSGTIHVQDMKVAT